MLGISATLLRLFVDKIDVVVAVAGVSDDVVIVGMRQRRRRRPGVTTVLARPTATLSAAMTFVTRRLAEIFKCNEHW